MRFMLLRMADDKTESGMLPDTEMIAVVGAYMEEMAAAGVLLGAEGLHPTSRGVRVAKKAGKPVIIDGPFAETKELIGGYCLIQVESLKDAIAWAERWPALDGDVVIEIRQLYEEADFGEEFTPELREQEARVRASLPGPN